MNYPNPHAPSCTWYDIAEKMGAPNLKWCEENLCQWISEPSNTWSNLGYLLAGILTFYWAMKKNESHELKQFGPIIFFMGSMSFFYHLSNFYLSQIFDFIGMYSFTGWVIGMNLIRLSIIKRKNLIWFNLGLAAIETLILHVMYLNGIKFQVIILINALLIVTTEYLARRKMTISYRNYILGLIFLILAFSFSIIDAKRIWCNPQDHGWFSQGHALWHWAAAIAMIFIYLHYAQPTLKLKKE